MPDGSKAILSLLMALASIPLLASAMSKTPAFLILTPEGGLKIMLGEQLGEASGKITTIRVLPPDGPIPNLEISWKGRGKLLGVDINDVGTYIQTVRLGGVYYGECQVVMITPDGEVANWTGFGVGKPTGPVPAVTFAVCGSFQTASEKLARLNTVANVVEFQVDENENYSWKLWEWQ